LAKASYTTRFELGEFFVGEGEGGVKAGVEAGVGHERRSENQ